MDSHTQVITGRVAASLNYASQEEHKILIKNYVAAAALSAVRVWRLSYINFILEHSKNTHRGRCRTSGIWGPWSWLFYLMQALPHSKSLVRMVPYEQAVTIANSQLGPGYYEADSITSSRPSLTSIQSLHPLCRWRDKSHQLD
mgnify:CR=1 FL=1